MKKLLLVLFCLLPLLKSEAQFAGSTNGSTSATGVIAGSQINVLNAASTTMILTVTVLGAPASNVVQIETSSNNGTSYTVCGQTIAVTSNTSTTTCTGTFDHAQVDYTTQTGGTNPSIVWSLVAAQPTGGELDPCKNSGVSENSFNISISSATTTLIVASATGAKITTCGWFATISGTTPTYQFVYGTQVTNPCDTGQTVLTPAFSPGNGPVSFSFGGSGATVIKTTPASQQLCVVTTGTVTSFQLLVVAVKL